MRKHFVNHKQYCEDFQSHFDLCDDCLETVDAFLESLQQAELREGDLSLYRMALSFNLYKGHDSLRSLAVLCDQGYVQDGVAIARKLIELAINLQFVAQDSDRRSEQYWNHMHVKNYYMAKQILKDESARPELREFFKRSWIETCDQYEIAKKSFPLETESGDVKREFRLHWSGLSVRKLAQKTNMMDFYNYYNQFSISTHAGSTDYQPYMNSDATEFGVRLDVTEVPILLLTGIEAYLRVMKLFQRELLPKSADKLQGLVKVLQKLDARPQ